MRPVLRDRLVMPILLPLGILAVIAAVLFGFSRILLSLTPTAATVTAIVVASGVVITAAVAAGRKQVRLSTLGAMLGVTAGVAMLAGGVALAVVGDELLELDEARERAGSFVQLRREVDVLTLSATPIPRTLNLAMAGIRDLSVIETPPEDRLPIQTRVAEASAGLVRDAILRELDRGGQVFYVHNRVETIEAQAEQLRKMLPGARFAVGHGQMGEEQLEQTMLDFVAHKYDVLVATTMGMLVVALRKATATSPPRAAPRISSC